MRHLLVVFFLVACSLKAHPPCEIIPPTVVAGYGCCCPNQEDPWEEPCPDYSILVDWDLTMPTGAENLVFLHRVYQQTDRIPIDHPVLYQQSPFGFAVRAIRVVFLDLPVADLLMVLQHEFFGHGARLRELGFEASYEINPPFPYGPGGGATYFSSASLAAATPHERTALNAAGVESTELLARQVALKALERCCLDWREAALYLAAYLDQTEYIHTLRDIDKYGPGHDMRNYVDGLNAQYGHHVIGFGRLRSLALINYVDYLTYKSLYGIWRYIWACERGQQVGMLEIQGVRFLPGLRLTLAPYGPEYGIHSYYCCGGHVGQFYLRYGNTDDHSSFCMGARCPDLWQQGCWSVGGRFDFWLQPRVNDIDPADPDSQFGLLLSTRVNYWLNSRWAITGEVGGKTNGFVIGEKLDGSLIARIGVTIRDF